MNGWSWMQGDRTKDARCKKPKKKETKPTTTKNTWLTLTDTGRAHSLARLCHPKCRPGPHIVLLLKIHFLPDMQAAKSTVTIQFSTIHERSATPETKPHTSADKRLRTPRKVGAKSSLHSISLTLAWLPVRHFNLISFPKLEAVLIVKESRTREHCPHMYTHTHTQAHEGILLFVLRQG